MVCIGVAYAAWSVTLGAVGWGRRLQPRSPLRRVTGGWAATRVCAQPFEWLGLGGRALMCNRGLSHSSRGTSVPISRDFGSRSRFAKEVRVVRGEFRWFPTSPPSRYSPSRSAGSTWTITSATPPRAKTSCLTSAAISCPSRTVMDGSTWMWMSIATVPPSCLARKAW